jgi:hypothetical protein
MRFAYLILGVALAAGALHAAQTESPAGQKAREFSLSYTATLKEVPPDAKTIDLWIPVPQDSVHQNISDVAFKMSADGIPPAELQIEPALNNRMAHWRIPAEKAKDLSVTMTFTCKRQEVSAGDISKARVLTDAEKAELAPWLLPNKLVLVGGAFSEVAENATRGAKSPAEIARAAYDYTVGTMKYDKPRDKPGWGKGSTQWACDSRFGNCTDFHAMIMSIGRTKGIPVKFEMGFPLPNRDPNKPETAGGPVGGYHCWAKYYLGDVGWVPVDASEAQKFADRREYFFGHLCENRVHFTNGRDVNLVPKQAGEPLNYFIYPYAEADGKAIGVEKAFAFKDK